MNDFILPQCPKCLSRYLNIKVYREDIKIKCKECGYEWSRKHDK